MFDKEVKKIILKEAKRQRDYVNLIASENFVSEDVRVANGSIFTNKYAEGYPQARYYHGCEYADEIENLAIKRLKKLFKAKFANVQSHSGSQANFAVYGAFLVPNDKILGMSLSSGGHLTHGSKVSNSGKLYQSFFYNVDPETERINYREVAKIAQEVKPKLIICGASAYSRIIDFAKFRKIADDVGAYLLADVAHIAGLIVSGLHPNPLDYNVDFVTTTTHKTLRGPRGGAILTNNPEYALKIDKSVFPGVQGGPHVQAIAAKAIAFKEASHKSFRNYQKQVVRNAKELANYFLEEDVKVVSGGTDNHLLMIDTKSSFDKTGAAAADLLYQINIIVNKNTIPFDKEKPSVASGIRIGTPAMTTKGWKEKEFLALAKIIISLLRASDKKNIKIQRRNVEKLLGGRDA